MPYNQKHRINTHQYKLVSEDYRLEIWKTRDNWKRVNIKTTPGVAIVAVDNQKRILLVREERYLEQGRTAVWNIPRGGKNSEEDPLHAACRELYEEAGVDIAPEQLQHIADIHPDTGLLLYRLHMYMARLSEVEVKFAKPIDGETQAVGFFTKDEILAMIKSKELTDSFTIAALGLIHLLP